MRPCRVPLSCDLGTRTNKRWRICDHICQVRARPGLPVTRGHLMLILKVVPEHPGFLPSQLCK